jgi:hypothetical protein
MNLNKISIVLTLLLAGCAHKNTVKFEPSNSPCLDALSVNLQAEGCKRITTGHNEGIGMTIACHGVKASDDKMWSSSVFYIEKIVEGNVNNFSMIQPSLVCMDNNVRLYISNE